MTLTIEPAFLRGYAAQLDAVRDDAWADIGAYAKSHCRDKDGLGGILTPAGAWVDMVTDIVDDLMAKGDTLIRFTAKDLRLTVEEYEATDANGAELLWRALSSDYEIPDDYREKDVSSGTATFSAGPALTLPPPGRYSDAEDYKKSVYGVVGWVNSFIKWVTGYDLLEQLLPIILGDSGAFRRLADAHRSVEHALRAVAEDIDAGMDILSTRWTSDGGASRAFDYHIRQRVVVAIKAFAQGNNALQEIYQSFAAQYNYIANSILFALNFYIKRIKKALDSIDIFGSSNFKFYKAIADLVGAVVGIIVDGCRQIWKQLVMMWEGLEAVIAFLTMVKNIMAGDFKAFHQP